MRIPPARLLASAILFTGFAGFAGACSRPVLYYPTPASVPAQPVLAGEPNSGATADAASSTAESSTAAASLTYLRERHIMMPVAGAVLDQVQNSFYEARDGGERMHRAVDILAPRGTPVLSADDGRIIRLSDSKLGGISLYTEDTEGRLVYYYAHLDHYAPGLSAGKQLAKGDTIGFVGTTGNAPENVPHLHFQVMRMPANRKDYWNGDPIDPYSVLVESADEQHVAGQPR